MTIAEMVELAKKIDDAHFALPSDGMRLARAVLDLLSVDSVPCGYETPKGAAGRVWLNDPLDLEGANGLHGVASDEARALFVMGLRACDEAGQ